MIRPIFSCGWIFFFGKFFVIRFFCKLITFARHHQLALITLLLSYGINPIAASESIPRMWEAKGGPHDTTIYILAATHLGLPVEYDSYFTQVVFPVFQQADVLHFESAGHREKEPFPTCDSSVLDQEGLDLLQHARVKAIDMQDKVNEEQNRRDGAFSGMNREERRSFARLAVASLDEFELMENFRLNGSVALSFEPPSPIKAMRSSLSFRDDVASYLLTHKPTVTVRDLDSYYGVRKAYCSAGKKRILMLQSIFEQESSNSLTIRNQIPKLSAEFIDITQNRQLQQNAVSLKLAPLDKELICDRTAAWLAEVGKYQQGKVHFLIVGARHVHSIDTPNTRCPGVLDGLAASGFTVRAIPESIKRN